MRSINFAEIGLIAKHKLVLDSSADYGGKLRLTEKFPIGVTPEIE
jgi:hypothetical protein